MLLISVDRDSGEPLFRQIFRAVVEAVESGAARPGEKLPSTRSLAEELRVSRFTAERAYEELWAQGYTESSAGAATRIRARPPRARSSRAGALPPPGRLESLLAPGLREALADAVLLRESIHGSNPEAIDLAHFRLDPEDYPIAEFRRALDRLLIEEPEAVLSYGDPSGEARLRAVLAHRMEEHGVAAAPESIVVTEGSLQALDLVLRLIASPGRGVLCEAPSFSGALVLFKTLGLRALGVPMDEEGILPEALAAIYDAEAAAGRPPACLYTIPSFHNPTGSLAGQRRREAVLEVCFSRGMPVIEDCFEEEIGFLGGSAKPLASMDTEGLVFYLGTFSKVLFPGLRLGWIAASPAWAERLSLLRSATSITGNALVQAAVARLIEEGSYEAHVRRVNRAFSRRLEAGLEAFRRNVPAELARVEGPPSGGYLLWVSLAPPRRGFEAGRGRDPVIAYEGRVVGASAREGLVVAPGSPFWPGDPPGPFLRLSLAGHASEEIEEAMARLARALKSVAASSPVED
jgi:DNA-binding transcriptional MocR family regulator